MPLDALLRDLRHHTWVALRPSPVAGIGVFALRDIPAGTRDLFSPPRGDGDGFVPVPRADVDALPEHARHLVETYCLFDADTYWVPEEGFKRMDLSLFLNHADEPNVASVEEGAWFVALRDIRAGEELFVDYGELVDGAE